MHFFLAFYPWPQTHFGDIKMKCWKRANNAVISSWNKCLWRCPKQSPCKSQRHVQSRNVYCGSCSFNPLRAHEKFSLQRRGSLKSKNWQPCSTCNLGVCVCVCVCVCVRASVRASVRACVRALITIWGKIRSAFFWSSRRWMQLTTCFRYLLSGHQRMNLHTSPGRFENAFPTCLFSQTYAMATKECSTVFQTFYKLLNTHTMGVTSTCTAETELRGHKSETVGT